MLCCSITFRSLVRLIQITIAAHSATRQKAVTVSDISVLPILSDTRFHRREKDSRHVHPHYSLVGNNPGAAARLTASNIAGDLVFPSCSSLRSLRRFRRSCFVYTSLATNSAP